MKFWGSFFIQVLVPKWLRGETRNLIGKACAGSIPAEYELFLHLANIFLYVFACPVDVRSYCAQISRCPMTHLYDTTLVICKLRARRGIWQCDLFARLFSSCLLVSRIFLGIFSLCLFWNNFLLRNTMICAFSCMLATTAGPEGSLEGLKNKKKLV